MALQSHGPQQAGRPWIGLEHTNKVWIIEVKVPEDTNDAKII